MIASMAQMDKVLSITRASASCKIGMLPSALKDFREA